MNRILVFFVFANILLPNEQAWATDCKAIVNQDHGSGNLEDGLKNPVPRYSLFLRRKWNKTKALLSQRDIEDLQWKIVAKNVIELKEYSDPLLDLILEKLLFSPRYADNYFFLFREVKSAFFKKLMTLAYDSPDPHLRDVASYVLGQHFSGYEDQLMNKIISVISQPENKIKKEELENTLRLAINVFRLGFSESYQHRPALKEETESVTLFDDQYWGLHYFNGDSSFNTKPSRDATTRYTELLKGMVENSDKYYDKNLLELLSTNLVFILGKDIPSNLRQIILERLQFSTLEIPTDVWEPSLNTFIADRIAAGLVLGVIPK